MSVAISTGVGIALAGAAGAGATAYAAHKSGQAASDAAQVQSKYNDEALAAAKEQQAYQRAQYAGYLGRLDPYNQAGTRSVQTLSSLLGRSPYAQGLPPVAMTPSGVSVPAPAAAPQVPAAPATPSPLVQALMTGGGKLASAALPMARPTDAEGL